MQFLEPLSLSEMSELKKDVPWTFVSVLDFCFARNCPRLIPCPQLQSCARLCVLSCAIRYYNQNQMQIFHLSTIHGSLSMFLVLTL
jgi:hypothetical protein